MKVLFLTSRLPFPPHRGDRVRTFHFLKTLARDHEVHLISFIQSDEERALLPQLERFCKVETVLLKRRDSWCNMIRNAASPLPFQLLYYRSGAMRDLVARRAAATKFDLVYTHLFRMVPYAPEPTGAVRVLDLTDCISRELSASLAYRNPLLRPPLRMEADKIRRYEADAANRFDEVWTISEADGRDIAERAPNAPLVAVPNGVEPALFDCTPRRNGTRLGFLGNFSVPHNIDAAGFLALEIMPLVREAVPGAELELIGHGVGDEVMRLHGTNGTIVSGPVERLEDGFANLTVFASPLRFSAGIQNKIIEAMAAGVPVVTTSLGNRGLGAALDDEIVVRDGAGVFAEAVVALLGDPARAERIGENGRAFVRERFSWEIVAQRVAALGTAGTASAAVSPGA